MSNFCFATYANAMLKALKKPTNKKMVDLLLNLVLDNQEALGIQILNKLNQLYVVTDKIASDLLSGTIDVHQKIKEAAADQKTIDNAAEYFEDIVVPELKPTLKLDLIADMRTVIVSDGTISDNKKDELVALADMTTLAFFLSQAFLYAVQKPNKTAITTMEAAEEFALTQADLDTLESIVKKIPSPTPIPVPSEPTEDELPYICALLAAYAEAKGLSNISKDDLPTYPFYHEDLKQRRIEYYSADAIRNGIRDSLPHSASSEFEVLKSETHSTIRDTHKRSYTHGFDRLLAVMEKAMTVTINRCVILSRVSWLGNDAKKGVCHILVNDGVIKWVVKHE